MFTLKVKNDKGVVYELTHNYTQYYVTSIEGLTPPVAAINTSTSGLADGVFYNSSRLEKRNIVITLVLRGDIEASRQQLYSIFPLKKQCEIHFTNHNRNVKIKGYVESIEGDIFTQQEQMQVSIICPRPYFEGISTVQSEISRIIPLFEFPFSIEEPIAVSELRSNPISRIENIGDSECGCIITAKIKGTMRDLKITNRSTKEFFALNNFLFISDDVITISTLQGELKASLERISQTVNLLPYVEDDSTWFKLISGLNVFSYSTETGSVDDVTLNIEFTPLYGGV